MSGNLICKNNPQLFSFFRFIDNLHNHKSPSRPPGFCLRARAGPGLGPSVKTGLGPSKKGRARVGLGPGLGPDPSLIVRITKAAHLYSMQPKLDHSATFFY